MIDGIKQRDEHQTKRGLLKRHEKSSLVCAATLSFYFKEIYMWKIIKETKYLYTHKYCTNISLWNEYLLCNYIMTCLNMKIKGTTFSKKKYQDLSCYDLEEINFHKRNKGIKKKRKKNYTICILKNKECLNHLCKNIHIPGMVSF